MSQQFRIKADYGTVCGYNGTWLVQQRFNANDEWTTVYFADSKADAVAYIENMPDWAKG